jgi:CRISPR-associated endonuclease Cas1/CRISPR-associated protein Cas4
MNPSEGNPVEKSAERDRPNRPDRLAPDRNRQEKSRRAISDSEAKNPIFEKALEVLRRELPSETPASPEEKQSDSAASKPQSSADSQGSEPVSAAASPTGHSPATLDTPIPARMMNEFVYCQRLFYYEFVEGVFVESVDTLRGKAIHQRVDSGKGALPSAKGGTSDSPDPEGESNNGSSATKKNPARKRQSPREPKDTTAEKGPASKPQTDPEPTASSQNSATAGDSTGGSSKSADQKSPDESEVIHSRSVQLGSDRLGIVAKMDLVEVREATRANEEGDLFSALEVCPVDYKAGAPREGEDANELWDTDKMQLGLQALILRDNGYTCNDGVIYYRATKQRIRLPITPELEQWILQQIAEAKRVVTGPIPAPLVHSPKCVRCSLAPVCLPDETRMLAGISDSGSATAPGASVDPASTTGHVTEPDSTRDDSDHSADAVLSDTREAQTFPRRLIAARDDTRPLYLNTPGYRVGCKDEVLTIKDKDKPVDEVRIRNLSHVALFGNIQISTQAIQVLCEQEVPVTYFSMGGWFYGITRGHSLKNVFLRMEQFRLARDQAACLSLARQFVHGKIRNQRTLLMRNHLEPPDAAILKLKRASEDALNASSLEELLGIEGAAASNYFQNFNGMVKVEDDLPGLDLPIENTKQRTFNFNFNHRNRRPPTDPVNAMLSLAYSLLSKDCTLAALAVGFDPYLGFYHQPRFGRPALGLDLMEEFRPLIAESTVLSCINNRVITDKDFMAL